MFIGSVDQLMKKLLKITLIQWRQIEFLESHSSVQLTFINIKACNFGLPACHWTCLENNTYLEFFSYLKLPRKHA